MRMTITGSIDTDPAGMGTKSQSLNLFAPIELHGLVPVIRMLSHNISQCVQIPRCQAIVFASGRSGHHPAPVGSIDFLSAICSPEYFAFRDNMKMAALEAQHPNIRLAADTALCERQRERNREWNVRGSGTTLGEGEAEIADPVRVSTDKGHVRLVLELGLADSSGLTDRFPDRAGADPVEPSLGEHRGLSDL